MLADSAEFGADVDRNALFSKYKHSVAQGMQQAEAVRQQQQMVVQFKQELKVHCRAVLCCLPYMCARAPTPRAWQTYCLNVASTHASFHTAVPDINEACGMCICGCCLLSPQDGGVEVNAAKAEIDSLTEQLEVKTQAAGSSGSTGGEPGVLDDEHYQLLQQLKAAKAR